MAAVTCKHTYPATEMQRKTSFRLMRVVRERVADALVGTLSPGQWWIWTKREMCEFHIRMLCVIAVWKVGPCAPLE